MPHVDCKAKGCTRSGCWIDADEQGAKLCFRTRHNGETHQQSFAADELERIVIILKTLNEHGPEFYLNKTV